MTVQPQKVKSEQVAGWPCGWVDRVAKHSCPRRLIPRRGSAPATAPHSGAHWPGHIWSPGTAQQPLVLLSEDLTLWLHVASIC